MASVEIRGLDEVKRLPRRLERAQERQKEKFASKLKRRIRQLMAPDTRTGRMRDSVDVVVVGDRIVAGSSHPGIKAQERGAYIVAKGTALKFEGSGGVQYTRNPVRLPAKNWFQRAMRDTGVYARESFKEAFSQLRDF